MEEKSSILLAVLLLSNVNLFSCTELLFQLEANDEMCFFEEIKSGEKTIIEFQVIDGGNLDCDLILKAPSGKILYKETAKQYDSYTWTTDEAGVYTWCFSNKMSTFTSKRIYFDFLAGDEPALLPGGAPGVDVGSMTALEMATVNIHESLKVVEDYQKHFRLREMSGRSFAEDLNTRVMWWSTTEFAFILLILFAQVYTIRSFFSDKKNRVST